MRSIPFLAALSVAAGLAVSAQAQSAQAQTVDVAVSISPDMDRKVRELGRTDIENLARDLEQRVARDLEARGALSGARIELTLTDVTPNRPTSQQIADRPGLSYFHSFGVGGASVEGRIVTADGESRPVRYNWYSTDIRDARFGGTWDDANRAFMNLSRRLADGRL